MDSGVLQDVYEILSLELFWEGGLQAEAEERSQDIEEHVEYRQDQNEKRLQTKVTKVAIELQWINIGGGKRQYKTIYNFLGWRQFLMGPHLI